MVKRAQKLVVVAPAAVVHAVLSDHPAQSSLHSASISDTASDILYIAVYCVFLHVLHNRLHSQVVAHPIPSTLDSFDIHSLDGSYDADTETPPHSSSSSTMCVPACFFSFSCFERFHPSHITEHGDSLQLTAYFFLVIVGPVSLIDSIDQSTHLLLPQLTARSLLLPRVLSVTHFTEASLSHCYRSSQLAARSLLTYAVL